ncbi:phage portal protein [Ligilactobacillus acidipiscis]|uniref:phage portal protein n=1 Tax=Ligilactobacillus acidipiscis TaxID=89059 RepID=UPI0022E4002C|nr:phage portal protein [Ligilactobacillus acidipiscis]
MGLLTPRNFKKNKTTNMVYPSSGSFTNALATLIGGKPIGYVPASQALKNVNVYSAINRISSDIASAHFKTENTATLNKLERPSNIISRFSFWQGTLMQLALSGNDYIPLVGRNWEHVPNSDVQIEYLPGNNGIVYKVMENNDRPKMTLTQDQMLHFRLMPDPSYRFLIGRSPLESLQNALTIDDKSTQSNLNNLSNQINPAGKLKIDNYIGDGQDLEDARDAFEKANSGENSGRLMTLPSGFDYEQFEMKTDVFKALVENAAFSADQISKAFGVPSDILGGGTSTESQHSNKDQIKALYLMNLNTYIHPILDELALKLHAPDLELDIKDMLDVDDSLMVSQIANLVDNGALGQAQGEYMLKRSGFLPNNLPKFEPLKGGEQNADQD